MNKLTLPIVLAGALALPVVAQGQASVQLSLGLPVVMPQLVVVSPGVRVVPDVEEEVFFTNGYYWCRHDGGWYRSREPRGGWYPMEHRRVPPGLSRIPPGKYRKWHPERRPARYAPAPSPARYAPAPRPGPGRAYSRGGDGDRDHGHGHGRGEGHRKHGRD